MPRYLVERTFENGDEPLSAGAEATVRAISAANTRDQVTWIHSYVSTDHRRVFCVYEAASPEAVRHASSLSRLPVDSITEVSILDPYHHWLVQS
jgi:hypothetical protein